MNIEFKIIEKEQILIIMPLLQKLNTHTPINLLKERVLEMTKYENYECVGAFDNDKLIGISGLWYSTRHYVGKSAEPDHVIIDETYRGKNIGKQLFNWIQNHTAKKGCDSLELNAYSTNRKSHKFYYNEGFEIYGFHFVKVTRKDGEFY